MSPLDAGARAVTADVRDALAQRMRPEPGAPEPVVDDDTGEVFGRLRSRGSDFARTEKSAAAVMGALGRLVGLSRMSLRWQLEQEARRGPVTKSVLERLAMRHTRVEVPGHVALSLERPHGGWVKVPIAIAAAIAESRLPDGERAKYEAFKAEIPKLMARGNGDRARRDIERQIEHNRAVFLSRFFPVPKPEEWGPAFWSPAELDEIETRLRAALRRIKTPAEPTWWPDGWRETTGQVE